MTWHHVPSWIQRLYPKRKWRYDDGSRKVYLTFDDGPVPGATDYVLDALAEKSMKATFFMVGDNIRKNPGLARRVLEEGHSIGNHTFNHLNGWKTSKSEYLQNVQLSTRITEEVLGVTPKVFRPPYGLITSSQAKELTKVFDLVMWDVLSGDYQQRINPEQVKSKTRHWCSPGSIVLYHDQQKTRDILPKVLPDFLEFLIFADLHSSSI